MILEKLSCIKILLSVKFNSMYKEGTIIYFDPFYFKNGNTAKPKYFVVLKNINGKTVLASLPTRKDSIPRSNEVKRGCVELPEIRLNCFVFSLDEEVTTCGKSFNFPTHIYGHQLDAYEISKLKEIYPLEGTDYKLWGELKPEIFIELIV